MNRKTELHILNVIRRGTLTWRGRALCLRRARKKVFVRYGAKGQKIFKYHWQCADCKRWYRDVDSLEVDHIIEVGPFKGCFDKYVRKMYCSINNLAALCLACHLKKTRRFSNARSKFKRKKK